MTNKRPIARRWVPGLEINSEKEYHALTDQLARELLRDCTQEEIAIIAAQHMMHADLLERSLAESRGLIAAVTATGDAKLELADAKFDSLVKNFAKFTKIAIDAYPKFISKKATDILHDANRKRKAAAMEHWEASGLKNATEFARRHNETYGVTQRAMCKWISEYKSEKRKKTDL